MTYTTLLNVALFACFPIAVPIALLVILLGDFANWADPDGPLDRALDRAYIDAVVIVNIYREFIFGDR